MEQLAIFYSDLRNLDIPSQGSFSWNAPSNIALVKYWGKKEGQLPANASLSFTLSKAVTTTKLEFERLNTIGDGYSFEVLLDGVPHTSFRPKIETFFRRIAPWVPFLSNYHLRIETHNNFPHGSGIASSASGFCALALCILSLEREATAMSPTLFFKKASFLARLGSGSAARSVEGPIMIWGEHPSVTGGSDFYAVKPSFQWHPIFEDYQDTILLVETGEKAVSSSVGHELMNTNPYAQGRLTQAENHLQILSKILQEGDLDSFIQIVESEALSLHAMMMTSSPYFILMKPNTLSIIQKIWAYRRDTNSKLCFTLDAGANVHLLYPKSESVQVLSWIKQELSPFCMQGKMIEDSLGYGANELAKPVISGAN